MTRRHRDRLVIELDTDLKRNLKILAPSRNFQDVRHLVLEALSYRYPELSSLIKEELRTVRADYAYKPDPQ